MAISPGLVGPKAMAKAAADGQPVNIPAPPRFSEKMTKFSNLSELSDFRSCSEKNFLTEIF